MSDKPDISIVLPIYNQADHIEGIVQQYVAALGNLKHSFELVLVVNGNRDGSLERCQSLAKSYDSLHILYDEQSGWGRAVRKGLEAAKGDTLCYTNSARTSSYHLALHVMLALANPRASHKGQSKASTSVGSSDRVGDLQCRMSDTLRSTGLGCQWHAQGFRSGSLRTTESSRKRRSH